MTFDDKNIDKLFQDASQKLSFDFKEEYWNEMEAMLPQKKDRKKGLIWWSFGGIAGASVIALLITTLFYQPNKNLSSKEQTIEIVDSSEKSDVYQVAKEEVKSEKSEDFTQNSFQEKSAVSPVSESKRNTKKARKQNNLNEQLSLQPTLSQLDNKLLEAQFSRNGNEFIVANQVLTSSPSLNKKAENVQDVQVGQLPFLSTLLVQQQAEWIPGFNYKVASKKWLLYFDLNAAIGQSYVKGTISGSSLSKSLGLGIGISYSANKVTINSGLNTTIMNCDNIYVRERIKIYGFGVQNFDNEIKYKQLYHIEVPVMLGVKQKNHLLQFGIVPGFLVGSKIRYESKTNNEIYTASTVYGYRTGLLNFSLKPTFGYVYSLTPSLQVGANLQMQALRQIDQTTFDGEQTRFPINGQLFFRKSLFIH